MKFTMKKTFILTAVCLLPMLLTGQVYISEVLEKTTVVGPTNISDNVMAVSKNCSDKLLTIRQKLEKLKTENKVLIDELTNKNKLKRKEKQQLNSIQNKVELINNELLIINDFGQIWGMYNKYNRQVTDLFEHLQNGQCATIITASGTLPFGDYEIQTEPVGQITELIPLEESREQIWEKRTHNGKEIQCLVEKTYYSMDNFGEKINIETCPPSFEFSKNKEHCQREISLDDEEKLSIYILDKNTQEYVILKDWQKTDCQ